MKSYDNCNPDALNVIEHQKINKWFEEVFHYDKQILIVVDNKTSNIEYVSESIKDIMGYDPNEIIGQNISILSGRTEPYDVSKDKIKDTYRDVVTLKCANGELLDFNLKYNNSHLSEKEVTVGCLKLKQKVSVETIFQKAVEQTPESIFITDKNSIIEYINQSTINLTGYSKEELIGQSPKILRSGLTNEGVYADLKKTLQYENVWEGEFINKKKDGSIFIEKAIISPIRDVNGEVFRYLGIKINITEQKKTQENLLLRETAVEHALSAICMYDLNGNYIYVNPAYQQLYGCSSEEMIGQHFSKIVYCVDIVGKILNDLPQKKILEGEGVAKRKDGSLRNIVYHASIINDKDDNFIGSVWSVNDITEQKHAEEKVQKFLQELEQIIDERTKSLFESENKFKSIFNRSNDMLAVFSFSENNFGNIYSANDATFKNLGYSPEELIGNNISLFCPKELINWFFSKSQILNASKSIETESVFHTKSGDLLPVEINASVIYFNDEKVILGSARDITLRRKAEAQAKLFSRALEQTTSILLILDLNGNIQNINRAFTQITGYSLEEVYGRSPKDVLTDNMTDEERNEMFNAINSGLSWKGEFLNKRKNGSILWVSAEIAPLRNEVGDIINFVAIEEDITEKKKQDLELRKLFQAIEKSQVSVVIADYNRIVEYVNPYYIKKTGFMRDEIIGKKPLFDTNYYSREFLDGIKYTVQAGIVWEGEIKNTTKDGKVYWDQTTITPIINKDGEITHYVGIQSEISELKKTQEELVTAKEMADSAARAKSEFLANMSHEIRTPMNAVLGYSEPLSTMIKDPTQKNYLDSILLSGKNLLALINDILDLSKIEAGKLDLHYTDVNTKSFFNEFKRIYSLKLTEKGLDFTIDYSSGLPNTIEVDEVRLRQILFNLMGNAVKFTHSGYIKLSVFYKNLNINKNPDDDNIELNIIIEDTGIGMKKDFVKKIFDPFVQASDNHNYGGTGLGLPITHKLISIMGGSITVDSEPNKGSSFHIVIPNVKFKREAIEVIEYHFDHSSIMFDHLKMVIVDDVKNNRAFIADALANRGVDIHEAEDGVKGLALVKKIKPDIVITDLRMPVMSGYQMLDEIRKDDLIKNTIVIAYSASVTKEQREKIESSNFDGFLMKPVSISDLFNILTQKLADKAIQIQSDANKSDDDFNDADILDIDGLLNTFENELVITWSTFKERQPIKEIKTFAERLIQVGEKHNSNKLKLYGEELKLAASNFNVKQIIKEIHKFPNLIEKHKNIKIK